MLVEIEAALTVDPAPHLKKEQLNTMSSGDEFIPAPPAFEIY